MKGECVGHTMQYTHTHTVGVQRIQQDQPMMMIMMMTGNKRPHYHVKS